MNDDLFLLDIPDFVPVYNLENEYSYSNRELKQKLLNLLCKTSKGYCMYCYNTIKVNGNIYADLEHGIEKSVNMAMFENCVPNIGIACSKCNQKYKKVGERRRIRYMRKQKLHVENCQRENCKTICKEMIEYRRKYIKKGKILLHPFENCVIKNKKLELQYDLLNAKYIPSRSWEYTKSELEIIENHIKVFKLNSSERRNREVALYCKNVVDKRSLLIDIRYNNYIVELLKRKLEALCDEKKVIEICKIIYFTNFIKMAT